MLLRVKTSNNVVASFAYATLRQWRHVPQAPSMSTMRVPIARMLLSTQQPRSGDVLRDADIRRGLATGGDRPDSNRDKEYNQTITGGIKDSIRKTQMDDEATERAAGRVQEMANIAKEKVDRGMDMSSQSSNDVKASMKKAGNTDRTSQHLSDRDSGNGRVERPKDKLENKMDQSVKDSYDIPQKVQRESKMSSPQDRETESHEIPGSGRLRGTVDNFDDDPAISFGQIQDKMRQVKNKLVGESSEKKSVNEMKDSVNKTGQSINDTMKGVTGAVKDTVKNAAVKTKEFLTGEREEEKPDETKSEVRTKRGEFSPGTKVDKEGRPKDSPYQ